MEDAQIIALFQKRSHEAIRETQEQYGRLVRSIANNILGCIEDAQECENDTYLALWNNIPPEHPRSLMSYICKITKNLALMQVRHHAAQKRSAETMAIDELMEVLPGRSLENEILARELGRAISAFLKEQEQTGRILFVRRYWYGDPVSDIADDLHMSANAVSLRLHKLKKHLKQYLKQEGYVDEKA
jgi:RNA polymerase sigma-70 factor (ECF subfamily)